MQNGQSTLETITLAGGCFWCLEAVYDELKGVEDVDELKGVEDVVSGYSNGHVKNPTYRQVCDGDTGHAEVIQVKFDPAVISLGDLLDVFFTIHDPTTLNRQGNDVGTQYRSGIYYHTPEQKTVADASKRRWQTPRSRNINRCGAAPSSRKSCPSRITIRRKTTIRNTSSITRTRATASSWSRPRSPRPARSSSRC